MITIRPITTKSDYDQYFAARLKNAHNGFQFSIKSNIALDKNKYEIDAYDRYAFHWGVFASETMIASVRAIVNAKEKNNAYYANNIDFITKNSQNIEPNYSMALFEYCSDIDTSIPLLNDLVEGLEQDKIAFNEISRISRISSAGGKYLMNYLLCFGHAYNRFNNIKHTYFDANQEHCLYYKRFFNCKSILPEISFYPQKKDNPFKMMQADTYDLPPQMEAIASQIHNMFIQAGEICSINLNDLK